MRGSKRGEYKEPLKKKMTAFQKAEALAGQRYDRDKLLTLVQEVTTHFRMPNSFERSKMRAVCRYLADALDRCSVMTTSELVENAGVPDRFQQVVILYLGTYEARVSDVYRTSRHKAIALAHFWRFIRDKHPNVKRCSEILPRHVRDYIPHAITRARAVQRGLAPAKRYVQPHTVG
jgi:hypothetical protein